MQIIKRKGRSIFAIPDDSYKQNAIVIWYPMGKSNPYRFQNDILQEADECFGILPYIEEAKYTMKILPTQYSYQEPYPHQEAHSFYLIPAPYTDDQYVKWNFIVQSLDNIRKDLHKTHPEVQNVYIPPIHDIPTEHQRFMSKWNNMKQRIMDYTILYQNIQQNWILIDD